MCVYWVLYVATLCFYTSDFLGSLVVERAPLLACELGILAFNLFHPAFWVPYNLCSGCSQPRGA